MQALLIKETRAIARAQLLSDLAAFFVSQKKRLSARAVHATLFSDPQRTTLKPGVSLHPELLMNNQKLLSIMLDLLLSDPAQVMRSYPSVILALETTMGIAMSIRDTALPPVALTTASPSLAMAVVADVPNPYSGQFDEPKAVGPVTGPNTDDANVRLPKKSASALRAKGSKVPRIRDKGCEAEAKVVTPKTEDNVSKSCSPYRSLDEAVLKTWGPTVADITKKWPPSSKKPALQTLASLLRNPKTTLLEDSGLLREVRRLLGPQLPLASYPPELQQKLLRSEGPA